MRHSSAYCCYMVSKKLLMFGPLPIRIVAGITFIAHGLPKFENIAGTQGFFGSIGLPPELALPIGLLAVIGGLFLLVGVVTRIAAALLIIDMIGAIFLVKISKGFVGGECILHHSFFITLFSSATLLSSASALDVICRSANHHPTY